MGTSWQWTRAFTDRLVDDVKLVSSSLVCLPEIDAGGWGPKVPSTNQHPLTTLSVNFTSSCNCLCVCDSEGSHDLQLLLVLDLQHAIYMQQPWQGALSQAVVRQSSILAWRANKHVSMASLQAFEVL